LTLTFARQHLATGLLPQGNLRDLLREIPAGGPI
jgi:hypothetical protein